MIRTSKIAILAVAFCSLAPLCSASTIHVGFQILDLTYDGATITDSGDSLGGTADKLDALTVRVDGATLGSITEDIYADVNIPVALSAPIGGVSTGTSEAGSFDLHFNGEYLKLNVDEVGITMLDSGGATVVFLADLDAVVAGQALPFGLTIGEPVEVSLSASVTGDYTSFSASGTGEVRGGVVPEPAALLLSGLLGVVGVSRRVRVS